ncbi:hypothetical protein AXF42_Ash021461 [Apostasia shenzhenica]|uniref:Cystatin domain-containing protein n=1 Tax=Apostasia shenzhenica TaxID=1088818 RepID=A0A2H9ZUF1_9ASPA|nr:hypothetical protein AXF42_Ash021461 [Apostasia shenzhenica]
MASACRLLSHVVVLLLCCSPMATARLPKHFTPADFDPELELDIARIAFQLYVRRGTYRVETLVGYEDVDFRTFERTASQNTDGIRYYAEIWGLRGAGQREIGVRVWYTVLNYDNDLTVRNVMLSTIAFRIIRNNHDGL